LGGAEPVRHGGQLGVGQRLLGENLVPAPTTICQQRASNLKTFSCCCGALERNVYEQCNGVGLLFSVGKERVTEMATATSGTRRNTAFHLYRGKDEGKTNPLMVAPLAKAPRDGPFLFDEPLFPLRF
jgi:hypothetical protein